MEGGIDFTISDTLHPNLGGQSTDGGEEGILFNGTDKKNDVYMRNVLVQVTAMSHYTSKSADQNGHKGDFCQFVVDSGKTVDVRFNIWDLEGKLLTVPPDIKTVAGMGVTDQTRIDKLMVEVLNCTKNEWG